MLLSTAGGTHLFLTSAALQTRTPVCAPHTRIGLDAHGAMLKCRAMTALFTTAKLCRVDQSTGGPQGLPHAVSPHLSSIFAA